MVKFDDTKALPVENIFKSQAVIVVPDYQRNYSWDSNEDNKDGCKICDLWNDLVEKYEDFMKNPQQESSGEYLLGPMVFVKKDENNFAEIVDGQQRLATLTTLFCAARDIILELDPDFKYSDMSAIYQLIENAHLTGEGQKREWDSWKLKLNQVDNELFEKYIQTYKVKEGAEEEEILDKSTDKYYKNSKKIQYFKDQVANSKKEYSDSQILLFEAYNDLSKKINDALILEFNSTLEVKQRLEYIKKESAKQADQKIRNDPKTYLGTTQEEFFNHIENGLNNFENKSWPTEKETKLEKDFEEKNAGLTKQGKPTQSWDDFIFGKIKYMRGHNYGGIGSYEKILLQQTEILEAQNTIDEKKSHIGKLTGFCAGITEQISNVRIRVKLEEDAYQIFESLNDKGQSLSKSNLIKNWIIKTISDKSKKEIWSTHWNDLITKLDKEEIDVNKFLRVSLLSRGYKNDLGKFVFGEFPIANSSNLSRVTTNNFYRIVKAKITSEALAIKYIENLQKDAKIRIEFNTPKKNFPQCDTAKINQHRDPRPALIDMAFLDAEYIMIPILTAYREWKHTSDEFILLVKVLVAFFFKYKVVSKLAPSNIEQIAFTACKIIANGEQGKEKEGLFKIIKFVLQYDDSSFFENQWKERFEHKISDDNAKFVLKHIESHFKKTTDDVEPIERVEIEHILPQDAKETHSDPKKVWNKDQFFRGYITAPGATPREFRRWYKKLGNLTNVNNVVNKKISNFNFLEKLHHKDAQGNDDGYLSSDLIINKDTVCREQISDEIKEAYSMFGLTQRFRKEWTYMDIHNRGEYFKELATEIWELPKIVCESTTCDNHTIHQDIEAKTIELLDQIKCKKCNGQLTVTWPKTSGPEYRAPTEYQG